ncbi:Pentatricopeptide repeat-containing protein [Acorus gramineus]|uniref:Pentatricopeptide repeat-containing protein n=1 Tax=Acorus gramineus TaxID=55184 RepID=A0AAV9BTV1_ACOGR|nr:Pentatricopeptide repeat-containing protein [Acorus gramineus]
MNNLINYYTKTGSFSNAWKVFTGMKSKNTSSWNSILSMNVKARRMDLASELFDRMPDRDSVSWTSMIVGYNKLGMFESSILMLKSMIRERILPTQFTLTNVLSYCGAMEALDVGKRLHALLIKLGLSGCVVVVNSLLNMYGKSGDFKTAEVVFDRMRVKDVSSQNCMISVHVRSGRLDLARARFEEMRGRENVSWNTIIAGHNQHGEDLEALALFSRMMRESSLRADEFTLASVLSACANLEALRLGKEIHAHIVRSVGGFSRPVGNALVSMYSKCGEFETALKIVERKDIAELNAISFTALLDGYAKLGDLTPARVIFNSMKERDVIAWTAMIVGYMQNGSNAAALELFRSMVHDEICPNNYTLSAVLSACSNLVILDIGKQVHASALRSGEASSISVQNGLITMYAKCGSIVGARQVFDEVHRRRDIVSWTSMIVALAQHGFGEEAIELFEEMLLCGGKPDCITYVGVISACAHAGLVERGKKYFEAMKNEHKIEPTLSHYTCMIDLFARAGLLREALEFIEKMPIQPDAIVWGSLLAACKIYKNAEIAKISAERLLLIQPEHSGAFSTLANVYSDCGRWEEAEETWKFMKDRGVKKEEGLSWV